MGFYFVSSSFVNAQKIHSISEVNISYVDSCPIRDNNGEKNNIVKYFESGFSDEFIEVYINNNIIMNKKI